MKTKLIQKIKIHIEEKHKLDISKFSLEENEFEDFLESLTNSELKEYENCSLDTFICTSDSGKDFNPNQLDLQDFLRLNPERVYSPEIEKISNNLHKIKIKISEYESLIQKGLSELISSQSLSKDVNKLLKSWEKTNDWTIKKLREKFSQ
jgi:hypothetical protein